MNTEEWRMTHNDVSVLVGFLGAIAALLLAISVQVGSISSRLKERFPTAKEEDYEWAKRDPAGHWEAHKDDRSK